VLGQFDLVGIPPAPRGVPQIEVTFDIDANGIVNVSAKDKATGKEQSIRIQASGGLTEDEIEQMVKDAESHAEEDKKRRELIDAKNQAEALIHSTEKSLSDLGDNVSAEDKTAVENAVSELRTALEGEDKEAIDAKAQTLAQVSMKLGEAMYQQSSEQGEAGGAEGGAEQSSSSEGEGVVDADFEEVDDDEKKKRA